MATSPMGPPTPTPPTPPAPLARSAGDRISCYIEEAVVPLAPPADNGYVRTRRRYANDDMPAPPVAPPEASAPPAPPTPPAPARTLEVSASIQSRQAGGRCQVAPAAAASAPDPALRPQFSAAPPPAAVAAAAPAPFAPMQHVVAPAPDAPAPYVPAPMPAPAPYAPTNGFGPAADFAAAAAFSAALRSREVSVHASSSVAWPAAAASPLLSTPPPPTSRFVVAAASSHLLRQQKQGGRVDVEAALRHGQSAAAAMGGSPAPLAEHELAAARRTLTSLVAHSTGTHPPRAQPLAYAAVH